MAEKAVTYGDYSDDPPRMEHQLLHIASFSLSPAQLWENGSLTAGYMAHFWESFFASYRRGLRADVRDSVRYIAAELIGNAIKYGVGNDLTVKITLNEGKREFRFVVINDVNPGHAAAFQQFIQRLLKSDPAALYIDQMEKNAKSDHWESAIGFLTIMLDYGGRLAWKFETNEHSQKLKATTLVRMPISETALS